MNSSSSYGRDQTGGKITSKVLQQFLEDLDDENHDPNLMSSESRLLTYSEQSPVATELSDLQHTLGYTPKEDPITIRVENEM